MMQILQILWFHKRSSWWADFWMLLMKLIEYIGRGLGSATKRASYPFNNPIILHLSCPEAEGFLIGSIIKSMRSFNTACYKVR